MRAALLACLLLAACKTTTDVQASCLPLKAYTPAVETEMAKELAALPPGSALAQAIVDYGQMRTADRACIAAKS